MFTLYSYCKLHGIEIGIQPATLSPIMWSPASTQSHRPQKKRVPTYRRKPLFYFLPSILSWSQAPQPIHILTACIFFFRAVSIHPSSIRRRGQKSLSLLVSTGEAVLKHFWKLHARQQKHFATHTGTDAGPAASQKRKQKRKSASSMKKHPLLDEEKRIETKKCEFRQEQIKIKVMNFFIFFCWKSDAVPQ